tara:strand:- start:4922 stop:6040 length:1119 start_codon:yes stop_codon:yes gene_type:complete
MSLTGLLQARSIEKEGNLGTAVSRQNLRRGFELLGWLEGDMAEIYIIRDKGLVLQISQSTYNQNSDGMVFIPDATTDEPVSFDFDELNKMKPDGIVETRKIKEWMKLPKPKYKANQIENPFQFEVSDNHLTITEDHSNIKKGKWSYTMRMFDPSCITKNEELEEFENLDLLPYNYHIENWKLKRAIRVCSLSDDLMHITSSIGQKSWSHGKIMFFALNRKAGRTDCISYTPDVNITWYNNEEYAEFHDIFKIKDLKGLVNALDTTKGAAWKGAPCSHISWGKSNKQDYIMIEGFDSKGRKKSDGLLNCPRYRLRLRHYVERKPKTSTGQDDGVYTREERDIRLGRNQVIERFQLKKKSQKRTITYGASNPPC